MKNYELISLLKALPAGYEVEVTQTQTVDEIGDTKDIEDLISLTGNIADIDVSDASKTITLLT